MIQDTSCRCLAGALICYVWIGTTSLIPSVLAGDQAASASTYEQPGFPSVCANADRAVNDKSGSRGTVTFDFDAGALDALGFGLIAHGQRDEGCHGRRIEFDIETPPTLELESRGGMVPKIAGGSVRTRGAILLDRPAGRVVIGNLVIEADSNGALAVKSTLERDGSPRTLFELVSVMLEFQRATGEFHLIGELAISASWAAALDLPDAVGAEVGTVVIETTVEPTADTDVSEDLFRDDVPSGGRQEAPHPDVVVADLPSIYRYGSVGGISAFAVGTTSCNFGTGRVSWVSYTNQHPVIFQGAFRLMDDRFEQIGLAWLKHGFYAVSGSYCGPCLDPTDGTELGVGCSDPYSASLNGIQTNMSPRSIVNPHTGYFPYPWSVPAPQTLIDRRLQIHDVDLDPDLNPAAQYFVQGHYITPDDAAARTHNNNASYRRAMPYRAAPGVFGLSISSSWSTQIGQPAVRAWQDADETVDEVDIQIEDEGLFILAAKPIYVMEDDRWRYSYALENLNSDRSARSFSVPLPPGADVFNIGFHDVDHHTGEPYSSTDWATIQESESITWYTDSFGENENANALRFGTLYNFYFDTAAAPGDTLITLGLFKPGIPNSVTAESIGPAPDVDCNANGVSDDCDFDCGPSGGACDVPGCGGSTDCNTTGVPDDCDIDDGTSDDVNGDRIPDECQTIQPLLLPADLDHRAPKHRYLSIDPSGNGSTAVALRLDLVSMRRCRGRPDRACVTADDCEASVPGSGMCVEHGDVGTAGPWWVQAPEQEPLGCLPDNICTDDDWFARVGSTAHFDTWSLNTLHIGDCEVIPAAGYEIRACLGPNPELCSDPLTIGTVAPSFIVPGFRGNFGDVAGPVIAIDFTPPDGNTNVTDVSAILLTMQNYGTTVRPQVHPTCVDLQGPGGAPPPNGNPPNYILNVSDLQIVLQAIEGATWTDNPDNLSPGQCP